MDRTTAALEELKTQYRRWADDATKRRYPSSANLLFCAGRVYIRKMAREGLLCVALVELDESYQRKGLFSLFLKWLLNTERRFDTLEVECIHNKGLEQYLRRNGWEDGPVSNELAPTLQKKIVESMSADILR